jgi:hypothetical protein
MAELRKQAPKFCDRYTHFTSIKRGQTLLGKQKKIWFGKGLVAPTLSLLAAQPYGHMVCTFCYIIIMVYTFSFITKLLHVSK